jgi:hypothetical protein
MEGVLRNICFMLLCMFIVIIAFTALIALAAASAFLGWLLGVVWWKVTIIIMVTFTAYFAVTTLLD